MYRGGVDAGVKEN